MCQSRETGRKLFAVDGSFPGFSSATTLACRRIFGIFLVSVQLLKKRSSQSRVLGPNCLISSVWMSSRPGALPFFSTLMPMSSSAAVKALVNPGSFGYRWRSMRSLACLFSGLLAVVGHVCYSIRVCHALRRSSEMALISSSPSVTVLSAEGSSSYFSRYSSISLVDSGVRPGT